MSHIDDQGRARMVDVSEKPATLRQAEASGRVRLAPATLEAIYAGQVPKGDVLATARLAGIQAAKRTSELIPLCHPLGLDHCQVDFERGEGYIAIRAVCRLTARTGVEMEALTAVAVAALTIYDMVKAVDRSMVIEGIQLEAKEGGRSGTFRR